MGGGTPKQFLMLAGRPVLLRTLEALGAWPWFSGLVVVVPAGDLDWVRGLLAGAGTPGVVGVVAGGAERQHSVRRGLDALSEAAGDDLVFVHDGVRPFPPVERFDALAKAARPDGALLALRCRDTLKREVDGRCAETVDRSELWQAQTPQVFPVALLREALARAEEDGLRGTDEAALVQHLGRRPKLVQGDERNGKLTTPDDLALATALCSPALPARDERSSPWHVGHGYDVHRLVAGRKLVLGGVELPHATGLLGHSDADVLAHAVADACLGAAGLGDLGRHFPDSSAQWEGASSLALLTRIAALLAENGFRVLRVDATLVAERPKIAPHRAAMERNLSQALGEGPGTVTVKATTTEGLGFEGRQEGMSAHAVALVLGR